MNNFKYLYLIIYPPPPPKNKKNILEQHPSMYLISLWCPLSGGIGAGFGADFLKSLNLDFSIRLTNMVAFFIYLIFAPLLGRPAMRWVVKNTPEGKPVSKTYIYAIVVLFLGLGFFAGYFNQPFLVGAVILGLAVPEGPPLGSEFVSQLELFSNWFLTSIFVTCSTMKVDLKQCDSLSFVMVICFFVIMVYLIKLVVCMGICRYCKMPFTDGFCLALILSCKGVVDICSYVLVYDTMVIIQSLIYACILLKQKQKLLALPYICISVSCQ